MPRTAVPEANWSTLITRAEREGTRRLARDLSISHEAVRAALRGRAGPTSWPTPPGDGVWQPRLQPRPTASEDTTGASHRGAAAV